MTLVVHTVACRALFCRCHSGYRMSAYPQDMPLLGSTLGQLNSQVAEQCNAALEAICTQMAYMSQSSFVSYAKYFLYRYNLRKTAAM